MSNPARRRGRGGNAPPQSDTSSARGGGLAPAPFDGPASRGGASSNTSSASRRPSNPPSVTSGAVAGAGSPPGSPSTSPRLGQASSFAPAPGPPSSTGGPAAPLTDPARDPVRPARLTDSLRNVDLPASFYNMDKLVRRCLELLPSPSQNAIPFVFTSNCRTVVGSTVQFNFRWILTICHHFNLSFHRIVLQAQVTQ